MEDEEKDVDEAIEDFPGVRKKAGAKKTLRPLLDLESDDIEHPLVDGFADDVVKPGLHEVDEDSLDQLIDAELDEEDDNYNDDDYE